RFKGGIMVKTKFTTKLLSFGNNTGIEVPLNDLKNLGSSKKPPVMVKIGEYEYPSTVAAMSGHYLIPFAKEHREKTGIKAGDTITVELTLVEGKREVDIPVIMKDVLDEHQLSNTFNNLSYSVRKEWARKVQDAKRPETLQKRLDELVESLKKI